MDVQATGPHHAPHPRHCLIRADTACEGPTRHPRDPAPAVGLAGSSAVCGVTGSEHGVGTARQVCRALGGTRRVPGQLGGPPPPGHPQVPGPGFRGHAPHLSLMSSSLSSGRAVASGFWSQEQGLLPPTACPLLCAPLPWAWPVSPGPMCGLLTPVSWPREGWTLGDAVRVPWTAPRTPSPSCTWGSPSAGTPWPPPGPRVPPVLDVCSPCWPCPLPTFIPLGHPDTEPHGVPGQEVLCGWWGGTCGVCMAPGVSRHGTGDGGTGPSQVPW